MKKGFFSRIPVRAILAKIHPVDKSLMVFMIILIAQSAYSIFVQDGGSQEVKEIDIIVRTSAASIFGYFLSANFIGHSTASNQTASVESGSATVLAANAWDQPTIQRAEGSVGFQMNRSMTGLQQDETPAGASMVQNGIPEDVTQMESATNFAPKEEFGDAVLAPAVETHSLQENTAGGDTTATEDTEEAGRLQVWVASGIGLFCLLTLLILRNTGFWDGEMAETDSVAATVVQFRDFISGCVGFLIGYPSSQAAKR